MTFLKNVLQPNSSLITALDTKSDKSEAIKKKCNAVALLTASKAGHGVVISRNIKLVQKTLLALKAVNEVPQFILRLMFIVSTFSVQNSTDNPRELICPSLP